MRKFLFILVAGLAIAQSACAAPDVTATAAALRTFGILDIVLSLDCSLGLQQGGQQWISRASPGKQPVLIARTAKGETSWPILEARLVDSEKLRIVLADRNAEKHWEIVL